MRLQTLCVCSFLALVSHAHHQHAHHQRPLRSFNITKFIVPSLVHTNQPNVEISCHYEGNFTMLQLFKGTNELFRFKPSAYPAVRSFPVNGVGLATTNNCGSSSCHIQLNNMTENATGSYSCDLEHDRPPYLYTRRTARMEVQAPPRRMPYIDGLVTEYGEGEEIQAICRIEAGSMVKWFVNGQVVLPLYGLRTFKYISTKSIFVGEPPTVKVQCLEERGLTTLGSKIATARWIERTPNITSSIEHDLPNDTKNGSETMKVSGSENFTNSAKNITLYSFSLILLLNILLVIVVPNYA